MADILEQPEDNSNTPIPRIKPISDKALQADRVSVAVNRGLMGNPADAARRKEYSKELGVEPHEIGDLNEAKAEVIKKRSQMDQLIETNPGLARYLLNNPITPELAAEDLPALHKIARAWRRTALDPIVQVFGKGSSMLAQGVVGAADIATRFVPGKTQDLGKTLEDAGFKFKELDQILEGMLSPEQQLANMKRAEQKTFTGALEAMVESPSSATDMVLSSLLPMAGGGVLGGVLKKVAPGASAAVAAALGESIVITGGLQEKIRQESKTGTTTEAQKSIATLAGTAAGGVSAISNVIARKLGLPDIDAYIASGGLKNALSTSGVPPSLAKVILSGTAVEGAEEMSQSALESVAENVALGKQWDDGLGAAAAQGLVAGSLTQLGFSPMMIRDAQNTIEDNISRERHKVASDALQKTFKAMRAEGARDMLAKVGDAVSESNLRNLSTDAFAEFVDHMTEDSDVDAVYVPVEKLDEVLLQSGMTESELTDKMPEVADNIRIARATKGDVRIPVKDYLVNFAGTPTEKSLLDHVKIDPEGMTFAESQEFMQSQQAEFAEQAQQIIAADEPVLSAEEYAKQPVEGKTYKQYLQEHPDQNAVIEADSKNVEKVIVGELNKAGRFNREANAVYAVPFREFFRTAAIRETRSTGKLVTPTEIYERYPLKYQMRGEPPTATPDTLTQPVTVATPEDFKTENIQNILKNGNWMIVAATNPNASTLTDAENEKLHEKLIADLEARGLKHEVVYGRYPGDAAEMPSVLVYGVDNATARDFANRYDQDSVLVRDGFIYRDGQVKPHLGNVTTYSDTASAFSAGGYTRVPSTGAIFSVDFDWDANDRYTPGADFYAQPTIQKPGSMTLVGVHYSHEKRTVLDGTKYGTGLTGRERDRVLYGANTDDNIKTRVDFYTDTGNGVTPESGLGGVKHEVLLTDIYDASINPLNLSYPPTWDGGNTFEQQVIANGFKGYFVNQGKQGRVVLLGEAARAVPVPTPEQLEEQKYEQRRGSGFPSAETRAYQGTREADGSLKGLPRQVGGFNAAHYRKAEEVTRKYMADAGLPYNPPSQYVTVDPERAKRIASAFDAMKHDPQDPLVKEAYAALAAETIAQYKAVLDSGLVIEFIDFSKTGDPYEGNPRKMTEDVINNNHMWVFSTREGFGSDATFDPTDNPLLAETEFEISGQKALVNDLFRVVHDYFGHVKEGVGFRASGEENAWRAHMSMFSPLAGRALTTETRGQNSWVNFGPYAEHNKTASGADTHYADQKIGLLPEWVSADGVNDSVGAEGYQQSARRLMLKTENLKKYGLKPGGKYTTREVVAALEARQRDKYGIIKKGDYSEEAINKISSWIAEEVRFEMSNPDNSGLGWYSWKYQRALDIMGEKYPELLTDKNARSTFTALLAITSDGNRPSINTILADVAYAEYRETGRFGPLEGKTARTNIPVVISRLQSLYDEFGGDVEKVHQYLMSEKTLGELKREAEAAGKTLSSPYEVSTMLPMAALEFGPKLGAFYANLMGSHGYLTMDRWWSRTFNRYRGLLLTAPTKEGLNTFRNLIDQPELSDDEVVSAVVPFAERLGARKFKTRLAQLVGKSEPSKKADAEKWMKIAREKAGDAFEELLAEHNIERAANTIYKAAFISIEDAPFGARDRTFMINATKKARRKLKATGLDISVSDIQAVLWFFEKKLYGELGTKFSGTVSYEDTARKIISGQLTTADLGSEDDGAIDGVDEEEVSVGDEAYTDEGDYQQSSFYSALEREIGGLNKIANKEGSVKPDQAIKWIEARQKEGKFKKEEVEAVGILDWLQTRTGDVKVAAIEDFIRQNGVQLEVVFTDENVDEDRIYDMAREAFDNNFDVRDSSFYEDSVYDATLDTARKMLEDPEHSVWELYGENWHDTEELESYSRSDVSELAHRLRGVLPIEEIIGSELEREAYEYAYDAAWESYSDSYLEDAREYLLAEGEAYLAEYDDYQLADGDNYREILFRLPHLDLRGGFDAPHFRKDLSSNLIAHARVNERVADVYTPEDQAQLDDFKKQYAEWVAGNNTQEVKALLVAKYESYVDLRDAANGRIITPELEAEDPVLAEAADRSRRLSAEVKALQETRRALEPKRPAIEAKKERVLFVEEVQSDWAQQGRDFGFILKNPPKLTAEELEYEAIIARIPSSENSDQNRLAGKPPTKEEQERLEELRARNVDKSYKKKTKPEINAAPFVTDTQAWVTLVTKRLLRYAAENGFTRISWTTGAQQADRYRVALLAQVDEIRYTKNKYGTYSFELYKKGSPSNQRIWEDNVSADRIMAVFGKDIGEKIVNGPVTEGDNKNVIAADNLTVGGSGMKDFYDKLLPSVVSKVTKSLGGSGKVELIDFTGKGEVYDNKIGVQQSIAIAPAMVEKIMSGLPLFKGERGSFNPNTFITTLTDGSDKSTVIHEGGHFYLEALADMAAQPDAPQQVKDDFRKTLDWFGIKGGEQQQPSVVGTTPELEQKAFHGSPHTFDRFSTSAIGSGEGAQAYGYGLYFADNKGVAEYYKETLADSTNGPPRRFFKGEPLEPYSPRYHAGTILSRKDIRTLKQARAEVRSWIEKGEKDPRLAKEVAGWQETLALLNEASSKKDFTEEPYKGRLYEVELAPEQDDYLLWDEPLSKQSEKVKAAVEKLHTTASERPSARSLKKILEGNPKGEDIYRALKNEFQHTERNDVEASKRLHELGIRGVKYLDGTSRSRGKGSYNYVVFSDDDVEITAFYQGKETPQPGELPRLKTPEEVWASMTLEQKRPFHEQWAQSFERYILEGKAPTVEMQPVFARFRAWMISVYKSIKEFLKQNPLAGKLNDDVRAIFDRLLATEEKIAEMERARSMMPLFASADQAGVTQAKFEAYLAEGQAATDEAISQLAARSLRDMKWASGARDKALRQLQREAKAKRKALTEEVAAEVAQEPITQARNFLLRGVITGDDGVKTKASTTFKLDRDAINELYPGIDLTRIEKMVSDAGMSPDAAAQMFGFGSGQELVDALLNEESTTDKIQGLVDQRMLERYGDLVDDKAIEAAADKAIHNRVRAKFLATGLAMLKGQPGTAKDLNKAARLAAEGALSAKKVRDITPGQYAAAERRSNAEAIKRAAENPQSAIEAQRAALLNNHMARIARDIREEVEAGLRYVKKFDKKELRKLLGPDYVEQIDDLLSGFDFRKGTSLAQIDKMQSLRDWIEDQEAEGLDPAIDLDLVEALKTKSYKEMTIEEFRSLIDAIKQIEHLGRLKNKLLTAKDQKEFRATVDEAEQSIRDNANRTVAERETPSDVFGKVGKWVRQMFASHRKFNSVIREMDGFKNAGVMWRILARPMNEAGDREVEMRQQAAEQIAKLFGMLEKKDTVPGNLYSKKRLVPGTNISMTQEQRIMFGMNWGNEGNRQRLIDGGLTGRKALSAQEAQAILDTITKEEWDFIQGVLDYIGSYKDQIAALEKQLTGIEPKWIEISPIVTKFGTYRGGYFPAKYDADLSTRSEVLEAVNDSRMGMKGAFGAAATRNGYAKERSKQVIGRPILLSFNVISQHVSEVTHRLAWQPWLVDANRLLRALDAPIREHYGTEILRELRNTVLDIATGDVGAKNAMEAAINHLRTGSTIVGMGWRVTTALLQPSGLAQSWTRLGSRWATAGVARYLKNPLEAGRFVDEKSSLMRNRGITMQREINEVLNTLRSGDKVSAVTGSYFTMIGKMQRTVDIPTWIGAYEKHLYERGYEAAEGEEERNRMENEAIAIADQTVIDTQSGGQIKDLASIQRGSPVQKLFTNFYSYFSATYNLNVETVRRTDLRDPASVGLMAVDLLLLNAAPVLFAVALKNMMKGGCDWGDTECLVEKVAQEQISFLMGQMVVLREVAVAGQAVIGGDAYGYQGPAGLRFFSDLYKLGTQVEQGDADFAAFKAANSVAGALFHYPAGQINSTLDGILAIEDGRVEGVSILPALIAGAPKE